MKICEPLFNKQEKNMVIFLHLLLHSTFLGPELTDKTNYRHTTLDSVSTVHTYVEYETHKIT